MNMTTGQPSVCSPWNSHIWWPGPGSSLDAPSYIGASTSGCQISRPHVCMQHSWTQCMPTSSQPPEGLGHGWESHLSGSGLKHSPESPGVAIISLSVVGDTLIWANTQLTETGIFQRARCTALTEKLICIKGEGGVSSSCTNTVSWTRHTNDSHGSGEEAVCSFHSVMSHPHLSTCQAAGCEKETYRSCDKG